MKKFGVMILSLLFASSLSLAQTIPTPNMDLQLPIPTVTLGPAWATDLNAAFSLVDSHNHTSGQGVPVPSAGLNINTDLTFNSNNLTTARSLRLLDNLSLISLPTDIGAVFEFAGDLWYNNSAGQHVQITQGMGLSLTSAGGFNGDYVGSTASASYSSLSGTFTYTQGVNTPAISDTGPIVIRTTQVNSNGVTITPPNSLAAPYQITLLPSLPVSTEYLTISSSGALSVLPIVDPPTTNFFSGYQNNSYAWTFNSSGGFIDFTNTAVGSFVTRTSGGNLTGVTTAASNNVGITFTPTSVGSTYEVEVRFSETIQTNGSVVNFRLWDGATAIDDEGQNSNSNPVNSGGGVFFRDHTMGGLYTATSTSPQTITLQVVSTAAGQLLTSAGSAQVQWKIVQLKY